MMRLLLKSLCLLVIMIIHARCEEFVVGDEEEWSTGANFLLWSRKYNFTVGDVLVFKYAKGQHDVFEVDEKTFRSCNTSSASSMVVKYESGNDRVELTEAKERWFICNIEGHCFGGMRFAIKVKPQVDNGSPSSQPTTPPSTSSGFVTKSRRIGLILIMTLGIFLKLT